MYHVCIMYVIVFDRQHVEATQATIFSFFSESTDVVKTSGSVEFPGSAFTPWISASHKYYRVLCTLFFDRHRCCDIKMTWIWKQMDLSLIILYFLAGKYLVKWNCYIINI